MIEPRFNLIDEPWIPIAHRDLVSLKTLFSEPKLPFLGGSVLEKLALFKLLLAISQAACTPKNTADWLTLKGDPLRKHCLKYLKKWHHVFYLYSDQPFLQLTAIQKAQIKPMSALKIEIASGNTTVLTQSQQTRPLSDAEKALTLLVQMGFALGGKKTDNSVVLSPRYQGKRNDKGKPSSAKPGPSIGFKGYLHSYLVADSLIDSLWLNLLTEDTIKKQRQFTQGSGLPPWQQMPEGEDDDIANALKDSIMGRLIPLSRFCLLANDGVHYSEGLSYPDYKSGQFDLSISVSHSDKETRALWVDPEKRPWRELPALLSFLSSKSDKSFQCPQLKLSIERLADTGLPIKTVGIWSAGLKVSSNAGEQYTSGTDDVVDSLVYFYTGSFNENWYSLFKQQISDLDQLAKQLYGAISHYYKTLNHDPKHQTGRALSLFWQQAEHTLDDLITACADQSLGQLFTIRQHYAKLAQTVYDQACPNANVRQLNAWAKHRINTRSYLNLKSTSESNP